MLAYVSVHYLDNILVNLLTNLTSAKTISICRLFCVGKDK